MARHFGRTHGLQHGEGGAGARAQLVFVADQLARLLSGFHQPTAGLGRVDAQIYQRVTNGLFLGIAERFLPRWIDADKSAIVLAHETQRHRQGLEDMLEARFGGMHALRSPAELVDVLKNAPNLDQLAVLDHGFAAHAHPQSLTVGADDLELHVPGLFKGTVEFAGLANHVTPLGRYETVDVMARRRRTHGDAVNFTSDVRPDGDALARFAFPSPQPREATRLLQQLVRCLQSVLNFMRLGHVVIDKHHAAVTHDVGAPR